MMSTSKQKKYEMDSVSVAEAPVPEAPVAYSMSLIVLALLLLGVSIAWFFNADALAAGGSAEAPVTRPAAALALDLGNGVTMKLTRVPAGKFLMGCPASEKDAEGHAHPRDEAQHEVTISKAFLMGVMEVTQKQYESAMGKNPSQFKGPDHPVEQVAWDDAVEFCRKLSAKTGRTVRLPTEAEWEYACRAGSKGRFCFGDTHTALRDYAWYLVNSTDRRTGKGTTHPVGQKKPNAWGLHDMHGNVWEWCSDWYAGNYGSGGSQTDPTGPATGKIRVLRGGSWNYCQYGCRASGRGRIGPNGQYDVNGGGFRVVVEEQGPQSSPKDAQRKEGGR